MQLSQTQTGFKPDYLGLAVLFIDTLTCCESFKIKPGIKKGVAFRQLLKYNS